MAGPLHAVMHITHITHKTPPNQTVGQPPCRRTEHAKRFVGYLFQNYDCERYAFFGYLYTFYDPDLVGNLD